jgi:serine/threonine protein kinase
LIIEVQKILLKKNILLLLIYFSFQDNNNLYIVMDLLRRGDTRYHIYNNFKYTES